MRRGKSICSVLKTIRKQVADANDIKYEPRECDYEGECRGTCPACEAEVRYITQQLDLRRQWGKAVAIVGISAGLSSLSAYGSNSIGIDKNQIPQKERKTPRKTAKQERTDSIGSDTVHVLKMGELVVEEINKPDTLKLFGIVEQMPQFRGGNEKLKEYLSTNLRYPEECKQQKIQGRVIVTFVVERDGLITDVKVVRSIHPLLDKEAIRVTRSMPKWLPGKQMGTAVRVKYTLPVTFKLQ
jgi:TonB family protein